MHVVCVCWFLFAFCCEFGVGVCVCLGVCACVFVCLCAAVIVFFVLACCFLNLSQRCVFACVWRLGVGTAF